MMANGIPARWRRRLSSTSLPAAKWRVTRSTMTGRTPGLLRSALPARTTSRRLMVSAGWAWGYTAFSDQYVDAENDGLRLEVLASTRSHRGCGGR